MSRSPAKPLDFVVIGAQKSGTTAFFRYLQGHPLIFLPPAKEVPYFSDDRRYHAGWDQYVEQDLRPPPEDLMWGKVTPQYMFDPVVPARMAKLMPDIKMIALLRNPIERAYSHYLMSVKRGRETRTFASVVTTLTDDDIAERARHLRFDDGSCYLAWGEYGRILSSYVRVFDRHQLMVIESEELAARPDAVLDRTLEFIGLGGGYRPANLFRRYHIGGSERRVERFETAARGSPPLRWLWHRLADHRREQLWYWYEQWNTKKSGSDGAMPDGAQAALTAFYRPDLRLLRRNVGSEPRWPQFS